MPVANIYPSEISQPNKNKSSGLAGTCFKEVRRNGKKYKINCRDQNDPKYYHQWINTENLKKGKTAQCGKESKYHCSHKTYYHIKGYRNTCPIAGVTGTYTQPATLRMKFDLNKKGISDSAKIEKVSLTLKHRCVGVDVSNSTKTISWGPNFSGFNHYPKRKVLKLQFVDKKGNALCKEVYQKPNGVDFDNPPLSTNYSKITAVFKNVSYSDIQNGYLEIRYGNNLSTNPGNIYIKDVQLNVKYTDQVATIEGTASKDELTVAKSSTNRCISTIDYSLFVGYKHGNERLSKNKAVKNIQKKVYAIGDDGKKITKDSKQQVTWTYNEDGVTVKATLKDISGIEGKKRITFGIEGVEKTITFDYIAKSINKAELDFPIVFEHNVIEEYIPITGKGCASNIKIYFDNKAAETPFYTFSADKIDITKQNNILNSSSVRTLYNKIVQETCGFHNIYVQVDDEPKENIESHRIRIDEPQHLFELKINNQKTSTTNQNKTENTTFSIEYITKKKFISGKEPKFVISNPTYKNANTQVGTSDVWNTGTNKVFSGTLGLYKAGSFNIVVTKNKDGKCDAISHTLPITIVAEHEQHYDKLFVQVDGPNDFEYDYLVAWEGDRNNVPIYINSFTLHNPLDDICISTAKKQSSILNKVSTFPVYIKNKTNNDIDNIYLELNVLDKNKKVTTDEWVELDGIFTNFKNNFEECNPSLVNFVKVINLTADDDFVDEENVYLKINKLEANQTFKIQIPYGSRIEKKIYLQILLFENPVGIHPTITNNNCTGETFTDIEIITQDAFLIDLSIEGEEDYSEIISNCPNEYFQTTEITYTAKNIDMSTLKQNPTLVIKNDPRLIPIKYKYKNNTTTTLPSVLQYNNNQNLRKEEPIPYQKVSASFDFPGNINTKLTAYTNEKGQVRFFVKIPNGITTKYSAQDLINIGVFIYDGGTTYGQAKLDKGTSIATNQSRFEFINDYVTFKEGETAQITLTLLTTIEYMQNELIFKPNIRTAKTSDKIGIFYQVNNLLGYSGILNTTFKTEQNDLIPNEVSKDLYFRVNTNLTLKTNLVKRIVEEREVNTLYVSLKNKIRDNKDVVVTISELPASPKYTLISTNVDEGIINTETENILRWEIDSIEKNKTIIGSFNFVANDLLDGDNGLSRIKISVKDFLTDKEYSEYETECCEKKIL